jgi:hypothetical protein
MSLRYVLAPVVLAWITTAAHAAACDRSEPQYRDTVRLVNSLRPDKAGQMRVFAADGSEFNAGQAQWMKARLREWDSLCTRGTPADELRAAKLLRDVRELLDSHKRRT